MRIERHPKLNIWVREDGCIYLPQSGRNPAHWTFGCPHSKGYFKVRIKGKDYKVHRLVAECYIPNPENKPFIDHINRNKVDNRVENLRWATNSDNQRNTTRNDRVDARGGTHKYEDEKQFQREKVARWRKTHKNVRFSDGSKHYIPLEEAILLLAIPLKERNYGR
mgnify:CR=1 FL=1